MNSNFPKYDLASRIQHTKFDSQFGKMPSMRMDRVESPESGNFKQVFTGLMENLNQQMEAPDNLLKDVMSGNVLERTFNPTEKMPKAQIDRQDMQYLYNDGEMYYFMDNETYEQLPLGKDDLGDTLNYLVVLELNLDYHNNYYSHLYYSPGHL